jgi:hypothetical protein
MWINVTLCERYRYVLIGLSIASTSIQDFMHLYNAFHFRFWPLVYGDLSRGHLKFFLWHSYTYSLSLTRKHKLAYNVLWKRVFYANSSQPDNSVCNYWVSNGLAEIRKVRVTSCRDDSFITLTHLHNRFTPSNSICTTAGDLDSDDKYSS